MDETGGTVVDILKQLTDDHVPAALVALLGVLTVAALNLYWNFRTAKEARRQPFLKAQLDACLGAARATGGIVSASDPVVRQAHEDAFWALYWGELAVLEDRDVESAMIAFGAYLTDAKKDPADDQAAEYLRLAALDLTKAIRALILKGWHVKMPELEQRSEADFSVVGLDFSLPERKS